MSSGGLDTTDERRYTRSQTKNHSTQQIIAENTDNFRRNRQANYGWARENREPGRVGMPPARQSGQSSGS
jgi:hypothetical protein